MNIYENFQLSEILYYKIGPKARFVLKIQDYADVEEALAFIKTHQIKKVLPVGLGANLLMSEKFFDGAILWFAKPEDTQITIGETGLIEAFASHSLDDLIHFSFKHGYVGLEWAGGLPSTVGGAVRGNVGAFGNEIKQYVEKVEVIDTSDENMHKKVLTNQELDFSYRSSIIKKIASFLYLNDFFFFTVIKILLSVS
jgi:UDP-N-acetylmuramate dehydrogenase